MNTRLSLSCPFVELREVHPAFQLFLPEQTGFVKNGDSHADITRLTVAHCGESWDGESQYVAESFLIVRVGGASGWKWSAWSEFRVTYLHEASCSGIL